VTRLLHTLLVDDGHDDVNVPCVVSFRDDDRQPVSQTLKSFPSVYAEVDVAGTASCGNCSQYLVLGKFKLTDSTRVTCKWATTYAGILRAREDEVIICAICIDVE
jgi:hypothetical protein